MKLSILILLLNLFLNSPCVNAAKTKLYEYHVYGQLFCEGNPWGFQEVELWDLNCSPLSDDHMANFKTDYNGGFELHGKKEVANNESMPTPYIYTKNPCVAGAAEKVGEYANRLYLVRHLKEHKIEVYMGGARAYAKFVNDKPYPKCNETCYTALVVFLILIIHPHKFSPLGKLAPLGICDAPW